MLDRRNRIASDIETNEVFPARKTNLLDFDKLEAYIVLEREHRGRDAIACLPRVLYCMEGEFEQIITKIRLSIKDNSN